MKHKINILSVTLVLLSVMLLLPVYAADELVITKQPQNLSYPEDSVAIWSVEAYGENASYHWYIIFDGTTYDTQGSYETNKAWGGYTGEGYGTNPAGNEFFMNGIRSELSGAEIYCEVSTATETLKSQSAIIDVSGSAFPPTISVPAAMIVEVGTTLDLTCTASDPRGGSLNYVWYETATGKLQDIIAINSGNEINSYLSCDTSKEGTRYYVCMVTTSGGGVGYTNVIPVTVFRKEAVSSTVIVSQPYDANVNEGEQAAFICKAENAASYCWWKSSVSPVRPEDSTAVKLTESKSISGVNSDTLIIKANTDIDGESYVCEITGTDGVKIYSEPASILVKAAEPTGSFSWLTVGVIALVAFAGGIVLALTLAKKKK